ncbi:MAG: ankyrin repeat domain-containing protein [Verrucomicrobia bacterium]|nr:ankyrin repeat domain-containing protein [Verrucomicrobiota bacterium]
MASHEGNADIVNALLSSGANVNEKSKGMTALRIASLEGHKEIVKTLLDAGAEANAKDKEGMAALYVASQEGHKEIVKMLLDAEADVNAKDKEGRTALYETSQEGHKEIVKMLLDAGADVNAKDKEGRTALYETSLEGHEEIVKILLDAGADVNAETQTGTTALYVASLKGHTEIVETLLDAKADVSAKNEEGMAALYVASMGGHGETVNLLLDAGANVNAEDADGWTALFQASCYGHEEIVKTLLDAGADVNAKNEEDRTALYAASCYGHEEIVKTLLDAGADVNAKDVDGDTALMMALEEDHEKIVKMLLNAGADVNAEDEAGQTSSLDVYGVDLSPGAFEKLTRKSVIAFLSRMGEVDCSPSSNYVTLKDQPSVIFSFSNFNEADPGGTSILDSVSVNANAAVTFLHISTTDPEAELPELGFEQVGQRRKSSWWIRDQFFAEVKRDDRGRLIEVNYGKDLDGRGRPEYERIADQENLEIQTSKGAALMKFLKRLFGEPLPDLGALSGRATALLIECEGEKSASVQERVEELLRPAMNPHGCRVVSYFNADIPTLPEEGGRAGRLRFGAGGMPVGVSLNALLAYEMLGKEKGLSYSIDELAFWIHTVQSRKVLATLCLSPTPFEGDVSLTEINAVAILLDGVQRPDSLEMPMVEQADANLCLGGRLASFVRKGDDVEMIWLGGLSDNEKQARCDSVPAGRRFCRCTTHTGDITCTTIVLLNDAPK